MINLVADQFLGCVASRGCLHVVWRFPDWGYPQSSSEVDRIFHEINRPMLTWGTPKKQKDRILNIFQPDPYLPSFGLGIT